MVLSWPHVKAPSHPVMARGADVWLWGATAPLLQSSPVWEGGWGRTSWWGKKTPAQPSFLILSLAPGPPVSHPNTPPCLSCLLPAPFPPHCLPYSPPKHRSETVLLCEAECCQCNPPGDAGGEFAGRLAGLGAEESTGMFAVPCSKPCSFLPPVALNSCFCLLGLETWKSLRVAQPCQEERAQGDVGAPSSVNPGRGMRTRKGHGFPLRHQWLLEVQRGGKPLGWGSSCSGLSTRPSHDCCIGCNLQIPSRVREPPTITPTSTVPPIPHHHPSILAVRWGDGAAGPAPSPHAVGSGLFGGGSSQAHTGSQVRRAGPCASRRDVVFSHSTGAGPSSRETLGGFVSHTGCHQEMQIHSFSSGAVSLHMQKDPRA